MFSKLKLKVFFNFKTLSELNYFIKIINSYKEIKFDAVTFFWKFNSEAFISVLKCYDFFLDSECTFFFFFAVVYLFYLSTIDTTNKQNCMKKYIKCTYIVQNNIWNYLRRCFLFSPTHTKIIPRISSLKFFIINLIS